MQEFSQKLQYLLASNSMDIIAGDFNYDLLKVSRNKYLDIFTHHVQIVNKPTHISGFLLHFVNIKRALMEEFLIDVFVENMHFSDHDAVRIGIDKNYVDFHINP